MARARKINKTDYDALSDGAKEFYVKGTGKDAENYVLDVEPDDDVSALKTAKDRETQAAKELRAALKTKEKEAKELSDKLAEIEDTGNKTAGNVAAVEESYKKKLLKKDEEHTATISKRDSFIKQTLVDNVALAIATKISDAPELLVPVLVKRIAADLDGDAPKTVFLDKEGKPSPALTREDIEKEFVANPAYARIIIGSKASGSGGAGQRQAQQRNSGGAGFDPNNLDKVDLTKLSGKALVEATAAKREARLGSMHKQGAGAE